MNEPCSGFRPRCALQHPEPPTRSTSRPLIGPGRQVSATTPVLDPRNMTADTLIKKIADIAISRCSICLDSSWPSGRMDSLQEVPYLASFQGVAGILHETP